MKKLLTLLFPLALACGGETTTPPEATPVPEPTKVVVPCTPTGVVGDSGPVYRGDCAETPECKNTNDNFYIGDCRTKS